MHASSREQPVSFVVCRKRTTTVSPRDRVNCGMPVGRVGEDLELVSVRYRSATGSLHFDGGDGGDGGGSPPCSRDDSWSLPIRGGVRVCRGLKAERVSAPWVACSEFFWSPGQMPTACLTSFSMQRLGPLIKLARPARRIPPPAFCKPQPLRYMASIAPDTTTTPTTMPSENRPNLPSRQLSTTHVSLSLSLNNGGPVLTGPQERRLLFVTFPRCTQVSGHLWPHSPSGRELRGPIAAM